jgi:hypothetical protein
MLQERERGGAGGEEGGRVGGGREEERGCMQSGSFKCEHPLMKVFFNQ